MVSTSMADSSSMNEYGLLRTYSSSIRLNAQHYLWKDAVGYNVHPDIPVRNHRSTKIADVGTGTGIWPVDTNREYPSIQIDAFDISLVQCPPQEWLPTNLSIRELDIFSQLPEDLVGKYDVVHVRLFLVVIKNEDPLPMLKNLVKMLKPGGYIQWSEHNVSTMSVASAGTEQQDTAMYKLLQMMTGAGVGGWVPRLSQTFEQEGLLDAQTYRYPITPQSRLYWTQMQFNSTEEYSIVAMDNSTPDATGPQCRRLIEEAVRESREGVALDYIPEVTIGRKPL